MGDVELTHAQQPDVGSRPLWPMLVVFLVIVAGIGAAFVLASRTPTAVTEVQQLVVTSDAPVTFVTDPASSAQPPFTNATVAGPAASLALSLPGSVASARIFDAIAALGLDAAETQAVRSTVTAVTSEGVLSPYITVGIITEGGYYDIVGTSVDGSTLWYSPPLLQVPADLTAGSTWTSEGLTLDVAPFTSTGTVDGPAEVPDEVAGYGGRDDCLTLSTVLDQQIPDGEGYTAARRTVWCPGLGAVHSEDLADGVVARLAQPGDVPWPPVAEPRAPGTRDVGTSLPFPVPVTVISRPPVSMPGGMLMVNDAAQDLASVTVGAVRDGVTGDSSTLAWLQHPGGTVLGASIDTDRIRVTTSQRALQSFDFAGRMRWTASLPDIAAGAPAAVGAVITVALVDGTLRGFDAATGEPLWSVRLSDVITLSPVRVGDLVVAADTSGYVVAVEDAGALRWARSVDSVESLSALSDGTLLIGQSSGLLTLLGADGDERWTVSVPDARVVDPGVLWGDVIALPTDGGLRGLSVDDGSVLWTLEDLRDARVTEVGLVVDGDHVRRVDSAGRSTLVTTLVEPDGSGPTEAFLVRLGTEWVAVSRLGTITFLGVTDA